MERLLLRHPGGEPMIYVPALALSLLLPNSVFAADRPNSKLFAEFVAARKSGRSSRLPDYSYAGYHRCEKPIPDVTPETHKVFDVTTFGAVANDGRSDRDAALAALCAAHEHDGSAMVFFPEGRFRLNELSDLGREPIVVKRSKVVLKGCGVGKTELFFAEPVLLGGSLITITSDLPKGYYWRGGRKVARVVSRPAPGGFEVQVDDAANLTAGAYVNMDADLNVNTERGQAYFKPHDVPRGPQVRKKGKNDYVFEPHQIRAIEGKCVTFAEPIHMDLPHLENVVLWSIDHTVHESGIEDLSLCGNYREQFKHHNGSRFGERFGMLHFQDAFNCWARRLRITDYSMALSFRRSGFNTFANIVMEGNPGHSLMTGSISYGNLGAYIREQTDSHHGLGVRQSAVGTVFLRCVQYANLEAHCGWPRASLYDLNEGRFQTRGGGATFFPHHGKLLCFWNWRVTAPGSCDFWPLGKRYGYFMPPIVAGLHGEPFEVADHDTDLLALESPGARVEPESLFEAQLALRLGKLPEWLRREGELFEKVSRYSRVAIVEPAQHSVAHSDSPLSVGLKLHERMSAAQVKTVELLASREGMADGFIPVAVADGFAPRLKFRPERTGVWVLRARMTNSRDEVTVSDPTFVYVGDARDLKPVVVEAATMLPMARKQKLYNHFAGLGGGEGRWLKGSQQLERQKREGLTHLEIEKAYYEELQAFYRSYGQRFVRPVLEEPAHVEQARRLIDGNPSTTCDTIYGWLDSVVQFDLGSPTRICRMDLRWKARNPRRPIRLELRVSNDPDAWYSVVNDEPVWEFSVLRIGGTLRREPLPGDRVSTLYFPERRCRYVRLSLVSFPNGAASEIQFLGP